MTKGNPQTDLHGKPENLMTQVIEVNDIEQLEDYRLTWNALHGETRGGSFFQTLDWLQCYWRHFGEGQRLRVLMVSSGGKPVGIVPLTVIRERTGVGSMRVLTYPLHAWGWFYGPIGPHPTATLTAAMQHIAGSPRDWDMIDLRWVDSDRTDRGRTESAMTAAGFLANKRVWQPTAVVDTEGGWDAYMAAKTTKQRNNLRRYEKRVAKLGDVAYERYRPLGTAHDDDDPRWDFYDDCVRVASESWQATAEDGTTISDPKVGAFFRDSYELAVRHGMADLTLLKVGDRPIAFSYNYVNNGYVMGVRFGYVSDLSKAGVGNVMYLRMLEDCFEREDATFDLGVGSLDIKRFWQTSQVNSYCYTHYPIASPRSQVLRLKHWWDGRKEDDSKQLAG